MTLACSLWPEGGVEIRMPSRELTVILFLCHLFFPIHLLTHANKNITQYLFLSFVPLFPLAGSQFHQSCLPSEARSQKGKLAPISATECHGGREHVSPHLSLAAPAVGPFARHAQRRAERWIQRSAELPERLGGDRERAA